LKAVGYAAAHAGCEAFNLGTGRGYSVLELVRAFEAASGRAVPLAIGARRAGDVAALWAEPGLAGELLGWRAEKDLLVMCEDTWRWQCANPEGYAAAGRSRQT
ncbi:MAG: UDP-glucose 4-epimerase, partial [Nitrospira sp.]|nr:UDP-glucose 4-epimerase [Nitrospira sp.]